MITLPPEFTSLYRLFLRGTSASVLHHGPATRGLRRLYRPSFEAAAQSMKRIQAREIDPIEKEKIRIWLGEFDERINNTLAFLHNSSLSRGLAHRLIYRLSFLQRSNYGWSMKRYLYPSGTWNPQLPPDSEVYKIRVQREGSREANKERKKMAQQNIDDSAWGALEEVVKMAEGRDGLVMGMLRFNKKGARE
ncbi:hypothetical protein DFH11DRAFT_1514227 [Phellopilus nigrolimitatus]|nr:hypothetical protein DFH11DRAFT_1514227 [Phellopilus nigrolimitatus]